MSTLWIGNFSFENELIAQNPKSVAIKRLEAELTPLLAAAAQTDDLILCSEDVSVEFSEHLLSLGHSPPSFIGVEQLPGKLHDVTNVQPWGWTEGILEQVCKVTDIELKHPSIEAVKKANSREFSFQLSQLLNCSLAGERCIDSMLNLERSLLEEEYENGFVLKENFGQSGRGQICGRTREPSTSQTAWAAKRLQLNQILFLEPKLKPVAEFGIQWNLPEKAPPQLFGITLLKSSSNGQYTGSTVRFDEQKYPELESVINVQRLACLQIEQTGYFGPVGIDAMIHELSNGERAIRPLQDVNARWTMGRLAIHWADLCFPEENDVNWIHSESAPSANAVRCSPLALGGKPVQHKAWCDR